MELLGGGADQSTVYRDRTPSRDPAEFQVENGPQQLGMKHVRQGVHLV
jgi:hypothetical protein